MKTIFINASPKKRLSASQYLTDAARLFVRGTVCKERLRTRADDARILALLESGDTVVFALPLYVDGVPSHVLPFLKAMETHCKTRGIALRVYAVCNNGFIEGRQSEPLFHVLRNFCRRAGLSWCGGLGIGGGVMLNVMRFVLAAQVALIALSFLLTGLGEGRWLPVQALLAIGRQAGFVGLLSAGVLFYLVKLGRAMRRGMDFGHRYTRILVPSFLFILAADVFFVVISLFEGGLFRGWLRKKTIA